MKLNSFMGASVVVDLCVCVCKREEERRAVSKDYQL